MENKTSPTGKPNRVEHIDCFLPVGLTGYTEILIDLKKIRRGENPHSTDIYDVLNMNGLNIQRIPSVKQAVLSQIPNANMEAPLLELDPLGNVKITKNRELVYVVYNDFAQTRISVGIPDAQVKSILNLLY